MPKSFTVRAPLAVSFGAIAGALSRYYLGLWCDWVFGTEFPYGTLLINISGCFVMGFFTTLSLKQSMSIHPEVRLLVATGFLGSYTTFSTYELDTVKLLDHGWANSLLYWAGSALLGLLSLRLGAAQAEAICAMESRDSD